MVEKLGAFIFLTVFLVIVASVGGYFSFQMNNAPVITENGTTIDQPSGIDTLTPISWVISAISFMFNLATFGVPNVPAFFTIIFWIVDAIWWALLILVIRGN